LLAEQLSNDSLILYPHHFDKQLMSLCHLHEPVLNLNIFKNVIYSFGSNVEYSKSLLQSSLSHDLSEIILIFRFDAQETFRIE